MAVENKYVNTKLAAGELGNPAYMQGADTLSFVCTFEVAAADDDGSIYRLATIGSDLIPFKIDINSDAITGGTDWDLGLYQQGVSGAVVDQDVFVDGLDISAGKAIGSEAGGLSGVDVANLYKKVYEHAGHTIKTKLPAYDLALTANTVGSAAGTVTVRATFIQG